MLLICNVCLRTDRRLQAVDDSLSNLFDELCDYNVFSDAFARFCTECIYILLKIKKFKIQCKLASETLTKWKKKTQSDKQQLDTLSTKMPPPRLSLSNTKNIKVYFYQGFQLKTPATFEIVSSKFPHIVTINVPSSDTSEGFKLEQSHSVASEHDEILEQTIKVKEEDQEEAHNTNKTMIFEEMRIDDGACTTLDINKARVRKNYNGVYENDDEVAESDDEVCENDEVPENDEVSENDDNVCENDDSDDELNVDQHINMCVKTNDDSSDDDVVLKKVAQEKKGKEAINVLKKEKILKRKLAKIDTDIKISDLSSEEEVSNVTKENSDKISLNELKEVLMKRFLGCGELMDENGTIIDTDVILNNLRRMSLTILRQLKNQVAAGYGPPVLTSESIKLLSNLHKKYSINDSKATLKDIEEVLICKNDDETFEKNYNNDENTDDNNDENNDDNYDESNDNNDENNDNNDENYDVTDDKSNDDNFKKRGIKEKDSSDDEVIAIKSQKKNVTRKGKKTLTQLTKIEIDSEDDRSHDKDKVHKITDRERRQKISKEELRKRLMKAFSNCGELKDEEGIVIDTQLILNSLDDMALRTLRRVKNQLPIQRGKRILTPEGIQLLSQLQKKFSNEYSSGFTVEHLPTKERMLEEFAKRQFYEKYTTAQYKCVQCFTAFRCDTDLENHIRNSHNEKNPHVCSVCNVRVNKASTLHWHLYKHRSVFKCNICPFISYQKGTMITHYNHHKGVIYTCDLCNAKFKSRSGHYMHMNKFHETKYSCKICGKAFVSESGLKFHHSKKHQGQDTTKPGVSYKLTKKKTYKKLLTCPMPNCKKQCGRGSTSPEVEDHRCTQGGACFHCRIAKCLECKKREPGVNAMKQHFKSEHPSDSFGDHYSSTRTNKHLCHVCGKAYQSATALNEHKHLHSGVRPYTCDMCGATFAKKGNLKTHVETHMPPTKECNICGKRFNGATNLTNHMLYHKPPSKECQMCGKMFSTGSNLYNHMKRHLGERRYKCDICSKSFLDTSARNEHVRGVHNNIRRVRKKRTSPRRSQ